LAKKRNKASIATTGKGSKQFKKMQMMQWVFAAVMGVMVVVSATGVGVYWFLNSIFSIAQTYVLHVIIIKNRKKHGTLDQKLKKLGLE
jgi:YidC/Oxa1 family membrane protein insertase